MWSIFTFGNGDVITQILLGLRILMTTGRYESLLELAFVILALIGLVFFVFNRRILLPIFFGALVIFYASVRITVDVIVEDQVNPDVPDQVVNGVPLAVALPAYISGQVGFYLTQLVEASFALPVQYTQGQSTFNRPLFDLQKILGATLKDSDLAKNTDIYFMSCVFVEIGFAQKNRGTLERSGNLLTDIAAVNNALSAVGYSGGMLEPTARTCPDFYNAFIINAGVGYAGGALDYNSAMNALRTNLQLTAASLITEEDVANDLRAFLIPVAGQSGRQMIDNSLLINAWRHAEHEDANRKGSASESILLQQQALRQELKGQTYSRALVAQKLIPMLRTIVEGLVYAMTPIILVLAFSPGLTKMAGLYLKSFIWLQTWGPMYAIMNFVLFHEGKSRMAGLLATSAGGNVNLQTYDTLMDFVGTLNATAADYSTMVPVMAWALVWGGSWVSSAIAGGARSVEATASQVGGQFGRNQGTAAMDGPAYRHESVQAGNNHVIGHSQDNGPSYSVPVGMGGVRVDSQRGTSTIYDTQGGETTIGANGLVTYHGPDGQRVYDQKTGYDHSGVYRRQEHDPIYGQTATFQTQVLGDKVQKDGVVTRNNVPRNVSAVMDQQTGDIVSRTEQSVHGGIQKTKIYGDDQQATTTASGTGEVVAHFPNGMARPVTGELHASATGVAKDDLDTVGRGTLDGNAGGQKIHFEGPVYEGKDGKLHMNVVDGDTSSRVNFNGVDELGVPMQETMAANSPTSTYAAHGEVDNLAVVNPYSGQVEHMSGMLTDQGERDYSHDPEHPERHSKQALFETNVNGSTQVFQGKLSHDGKEWQFETTSMADVQGGAKSSKGSIELDTPEGKLQFTGDTQSWRNSNTGQLEFSMRGGTMTMPDGKQTAVGWANYSSGHLLYADAHTGVTQRDTDPDGTTRISYGDPGSKERRFEETSMPLAAMRSGVGSDKAPVYTLTGRVGRQREGIEELDEAGKYQEKNVSESYSMVGPNGAFKISGVGRVGQLDDPDVRQNLGTKITAEHEGQTIGIAEGTEAKQFDSSAPVLKIDPVAGQMTYQVDSNKVKLSKDGKSESVQHEIVSPLTMKPAYTESQKGQRSWEGKWATQQFGSLVDTSNSKVGPVEFEIAGQKYSGQGTIWSDKDGNRLAATVSSTAQYQALGLRFEDGKWLPTKIVRDQAADGNANITHLSSGNTDVRPVDIKLPNGKMATVFVDQQLETSGMDQMTNPDAKGKVIAERAMGVSNGEVFGMGAPKSGGPEQFGTYKFSRDPQNPDHIVSDFTSLSTEHVEGRGGHAVDAKLSSSGESLITRAEKGHDVQDLDRWIKDNRKEAQETYVGAFLMPAMEAVTGQKIDTQDAPFWGKVMESGEYMRLGYNAAETAASALIRARALKRVYSDWKAAKAAGNAAKEAELLKQVGPPLMSP